MKEPQDSGVAKNDITGKTIREMSWDEIFSLSSKPMTQAEAINHMKVVRSEKNKQKPS